jgi:hypothetical protein
LSEAAGAPRALGWQPATVILGAGDLLPELPLEGPFGQRVSLAGFRGEACVLVFLRHLG